MKTLAKTIFTTAALLFVTTSAAQESERTDVEELRIAAMEALITAPADRALPMVNKVLQGDYEVYLKERALFILSQIDEPGAQDTLLDFARNSGGELQLEAIRMIGIGGDEQTLTNLHSIYEGGDGDAREAVLEALMIADHKEAVYEIAVIAEGEDFDNAVEMLSVMGATEELRQLAGKHGTSEALIEAYAISGDLESLKTLAVDTSDPEMQLNAIEAMGVVGGAEVDSTLVQIFRDATSADVREAALDGMMISGNDEGMLELYRSTEDATLKRELLEYLVIMDSEEVWNIIDSALEGSR